VHTQNSKDWSVRQKGSCTLQLTLGYDRNKPVMSKEYVEGGDKPTITSDMKGHEGTIIIIIIT
jgi:hypothetical protein